MFRIKNMVLATRGKPILITRLADTIFTKFGRSAFHLPRHLSKYPKLQGHPVSICHKASCFECRLAEYFLLHHFCLLGDRWTDLNASDSDSQFHLDWQLDYQSGYRFDETLSSDKCRFSVPDKTDIKYPWELSRLQHLPFLARLAQTGELNPKKICSEFENTVIDFVKHNPVGKGVNWACAMDISIRSVNVLLTYDLLEKFGLFSDEFVDILSRMLYEHGAYIYRNLEKNFTEDKSGNHYLSDLCGLIAIGFHFDDRRAGKWFRFASDEILHEIDKQIFSDGGNYEFSTSYQRLDAELISLSVAYLVSAGVDIPNHIIAKIRAMRDFSQSTMYSDGQIIQIGDNDSGHLFRIGYSGRIENSVPCIDELCGRPAADALSALFAADTDSCEYELIRSIMKDHVLYMQKNNVSVVYKNINFHPFVTQRHSFKISEFSDLRYKIFPDFGLVVFSGGNFKMFFRIPTDISKGKSLHIHSDFLHYEFESDGVKHFADRGSYSYTGDIDKRNLFRSAAFHNVPIYEQEQNEFFGAWGIKHIINGGLQTVSDYGISAYIEHDQIKHKRTIQISSGRLTVIDESVSPFKQGYVHPACFSAGYGIIRKVPEENNTHANKQ